MTRRLLIATCACLALAVPALAVPPKVPDAPAQALSSAELAALSKACQGYLLKQQAASTQMQDVKSSAYIISTYVDPICKLLIFGRRESERPWHLDPSTEQWVEQNSQAIGH